MSAALALLSARRALAPGVLLFAATVLGLCLRADWGAGDAAVREAAWSVVALAVLPLLAVRAARIVGGWRTGEGEWLGSSAAGRPGILVSAWLGTWAGGTILLALAALAIEAAARGPAEPSLRRIGEIALPDATWITAGAASAWTASPAESDWPAGARGHIEVAFGPGYASPADLVLTARRAGQERVGRARIVSRGSIEVGIPPGSGELRLEVACERAGARAYVASDAMEVWLPCASERLAGSAILLRLALGLGAWTALAIGFGACVGTPIAALALLAIWTPAWLADRAPEWLPAGDLWRALEIAGSGRVPGPVEPASLATLAALAAAGLAIGALGLAGSWRSP